MNTTETTRRVLVGLIREHGIKAVVDQLADACLEVADHPDPASAHRIIDARQFGQKLKAVATLIRMEVRQEDQR